MIALLIVMVSHLFLWLFVCACAFPDVFFGCCFFRVGWNMCICRVFVGVRVSCDPNPYKPFLALRRTTPVATATLKNKKMRALQVTLLGQNVDAYGRDMAPRSNFAELLHFVSDVPGIERVRFVTSHPRYMSLSVVDAVANLPSMAECFMVPFQSGDDKVSRVWVCACRSRNTTAGVAVVCCLGRGGSSAALFGLGLKRPRVRRERRSA